MNTLFTHSMQVAPYGIGGGKSLCFNTIDIQFHNKFFWSCDKGLLRSISLPFSGPYESPGLVKIIGLLKSGFCFSFIFCKFNIQGLLRSVALFFKEISLYFIYTFIKATQGLLRSISLCIKKLLRITFHNLINFIFYRSGFAAKHIPVQKKGRPTLLTSLVLRQKDASNFFIPNYNWVMHTGLAAKCRSVFFQKEFEYETAVYPYRTK